MTGPEEGDNPEGEAHVSSGAALTIVRCPIHGIAYDEELEECPECGKRG